MDSKTGNDISLGIIFGIVLSCILCKMFECYGCNKKDTNENTINIQEPWPLFECLLLFSETKIFHRD